MFLFTVIENVTILAIFVRARKTFFYRFVDS